MFERMASSLIVMYQSEAGDVSKMKGSLMIEAATSHHAVVVPLAVPVPLRSHAWCPSVMTVPPVYLYMDEENRLHRTTHGMVVRTSGVGWNRSRT